MNNNNSKKLFYLIVIIFFIILAYVAYDFSKKSTFPTLKKPDMEIEQSDAKKVDSVSLETK
jgi:amino acid permease